MNSLVSCCNCQENFKFLPYTYMYTPTCVHYAVGLGKIPEYPPGVVQYKQTRALHFDTILRLNNHDALNTTNSFEQNQQISVSFH